MFQGDLSKFGAGEVLLFLNNLGKEGVLTISRNGEALQLSVQGGCLLEAQSTKGDNKVLLSLLAHGRINADQFKQILAIRKETGLAITSILENLQFVSPGKARESIELGMSEVLFQLFLWESGQFQFADIALGAEKVEYRMDCRQVADQMTARVEEWRQTIGGLGGLDGFLVRADSPQKDPADYLSRLVLLLADGRKTTGQLVDLVPYVSYEVLKCLKMLKAAERVKFSAEVTGRAAAESRRFVRDELFFSYKRAVKNNAFADKLPEKIAGLATFCREHFDHTLIFSVRSGVVSHCLVYSKEKDSQTRRHELKGISRSLDDEQVFSWAYQSGAAFFGKFFPSQLVSSIIAPPRGGECAVIPFKMVGKTVLLYVHSLEEGVDEKITPFHYLELMLWHIKPPERIWEDRAVDQKVEDQDTPEVVEGSFADVSAFAQAERLARAVMDLPVMPHVISRLMQELAKSDCSFVDLVPIISSDQALVAKMIQVSNSVLYGGVQQITSLQHALSRLGFKAIRSIVITSSTRNLFPVKQSSVGIWGRSLWLHSIETAIAARGIAKQIGYADPEEAFVAGVLHDIGKLAILLELTREYQLIIQQLQAGEDIIKAENAVLGFDHTFLGDLFMHKWKIPEKLCGCIRFHHMPKDAEQGERLPYIIAYGDMLSHLYGGQPDDIYRDSALLQDIVTHLDISEEKQQIIREDFQADLKEVEVF